MFEDFVSLRKSCPALKSILLPDTIWNDYKKIAKANKDLNRQRPIVYGAFQNGFLPRITLPVHTYLLDGPNFKANLTKQYKEDLSEKWILKQEPLDAHQKFKIW
jgi:hypothetical protein